MPPQPPFTTKQDERKDNVQIHGKRKIQRIKSVAEFNNKDNMQAIQNKPFHALALAQAV